MNLDRLFLAVSRAGPEAAGEVFLAAGRYTDAEAIFRELTTAGYRPPA